MRNLSKKSLALSSLVVGSMFITGNTLAARNNNAPLTGPGSTMQSPNRFVQPAPRYTAPAPRQYFTPPPTFVPRARPQCSRTYGAGATSNCT